MGGGEAAQYNPYEGSYNSGPAVGSAIPPGTADL